MSSIDRINDRFQQAPDTDTGRAILDTLTVTQLQGLADLNYVDPDGSRTQLVTGLMSDRFGE
jgi:hypothetical protein